MDKKPDNVNEPIEKQDGAYQRIDMTNLKTVHKQCTDGHNFVVDPGEKTDFYQGYLCSKCGRGELKPL